MVDRSGCTRTIAGGEVVEGSSGDGRCDGGRLKTNAVIMFILCLADGELVSEICDGVAYVWPFSAPAVEAPPERVRFLSPFDPLVWDRRRFEHFWGWPYRFEAYTPAAKRRWGYYALPMLFRDQMIGWANLAVASGHLAVDLGYVNQAPTEPGFKTALGDEIERFEAFLGLSESAL